MLIIKFCLPFYIEQKFSYKIRLMYWFRDHKCFLLARVMNALIYWKHNCIIGINSQIHPSVRFPHACGIVVGDGVVINREAVVFQNVTLGAKENMYGESSYPVIGEQCKIYPNSVVVGGVKLSPRTIIGACSFLDKDTVCYGVYGGVPARLLKINEQEDVKHDLNNQ